MAHSTGRTRVVADYLVGRQIGSGSFSVVWHARHRVHGTEVAIKEISMTRLSKKLQDSLMSEIFILKRINHPNIIRLYDIIEVPGKIHLVLEYCKGGDLSFYIQQRHGRIPEAIAKHFLQQLAAGLKILRDNNLIHRDLKPQNLLLSASDDNSVLKIADFGFARSLQPRGLAETLCGSPLYMAPEIMQLQKYDAKADLWSVGAILFQLVTGRTPFTGNNQIQLLQNIVKSTELHFPSDINDLSFDCKDLCRKLLRRNPESDPASNMEENSQDDYLPFSLDDDSSGPEGSPSFVRRSSMKSTYGFSPDKKVDRGTRDTTSRYGSIPDKMESTTLILDTRVQLERDVHSDRSLKGASRSANTLSVNNRPRVVDSPDLIDQDYVIVSGPPMDDTSSTLASASKPIPSRKSQSPPQSSIRLGTAVTAPMPIIGRATTSSYRMGSLGSQSSAPGSMDIEDTLEQPSANCRARVKSLQQSASTITELVKEKRTHLLEPDFIFQFPGHDWRKKITAGRQLEAFSIQLVILAIWKKALDICHTQAASALEGSPGQGSAEFRRSLSKKPGSSLGKESHLIVNSHQPVDISSQVEREFLREVEYAEELAKIVEPGNTEMPDAIETVFQSALAFGRHGGVSTPIPSVHEFWIISCAVYPVEELMGEMETAAALYSKAAQLLVFLLVEAPSLILNPPFSLTNSDRYRLRSYIDILNNRQGYLRSQRLALLK
ncbi:Serine/threonine-protein kinase ATG1c [Cucurbita argyrosperma subsp. argyrosperma]|nr:Serine/threonine-protein kinase ATG1c [Cucurbita argyrosperma subsp. argyrosperma]